MHIILKNTKFFAVFFLLISVVACEEKDNTIPIEGTNSIVDFLKKDSSFTIFSKAVQRAGMAGVLDGNAGNYTVLAPDDQAMTSFLSAHHYGSIDDIPADKLVRLVKYHILETLKPAENFVTSYVQTLASLPVNDSVNTRLSLYVNTADSVRFNGQSAITVADIQVDNGVLHKVNHTLALPTLKTFMAADANLNAFYERITASGIATDFDSLLADPAQQTTIFVPSENAVQEFFANDGSALTDAELNRLYRYHVLSSAQVSKNFTTGYLTTIALENYSGNQYPLSLYVNTEAGVRLNVETTIAIADIMTINGNIEVIGQVLSLPTVGTFVEADTRFDSFESLLARDDQASQQYFQLLSQSEQGSQAPFTVFAPDNEAFDELLTELFPEQNVTLDDIPAAQLTGILNMHIVEQLSLRTSEFTDQSLQTLGGPVQLDANQFILQDPAGRESHIEYGNIQAINGVVHAIDKALLPN